MSGITCPLCGGDMEEQTGFDGVSCDCCGFIIRSDFTYDYSVFNELHDEEV